MFSLSSPCLLGYTHFFAYDLLKSKDVGVNSWKTEDTVWVHAPAYDNVSQSAWQRHQMNKRKQECQSKQLGVILENAAFKTMKRFE